MHQLGWIHAPAGVDPYTSRGGSIHQLGWIHTPAGVDPYTSWGGSMHQQGWIHAPVGVDPCTGWGGSTSMQCKWVSVPCAASSAAPHHHRDGVGQCREPKYTGVKSIDLPQRALSGWRGTPAATRKWNTTQHTHTPPILHIPAPLITLLSAVSWYVVQAHSNPTQRAFHIMTHMSSAVRRWSLWAGLPRPSTCAIITNTDMILMRCEISVISDKCLWVKEDRGTSGEGLGGGASVSSPSSWSTGVGGATR